MTGALSSHRRQFRQFALTHAREALGDRRALFTMLFVFGGMSIGLTVFDLLLASDTARRSPSSITGSGLLAGSLPLITLIGFSSLGLVSTAVPLTTYRASGVLRQLGTTPASRACFLLAHLPVRLTLGLAQILLVLILAALFVGLSPIQFLHTTALMLAGLPLLLSLGYLVGSRFRHPDRAMSFSLFATIALIATSGTTIPLTVLPDSLNTLFSWIPTTVFTQALASELLGTPAPWPIWATIVLLMGSSIALFALSSLIFRWDR